MEIHVYCTKYCSFFFYRRNHPGRRYSFVAVRASDRLLLIYRLGGNFGWSPQVHWKHIRTWYQVLVYYYSSPFFFQMDGNTLPFTPGTATTAAVEPKGITGMLGTKTTKHVLSCEIEEFVETHLWKLRMFFVIGSK